MTGFVKFLNSSIGKKMTVGLTGLFLCVFLIGHLIGNLLLYKSPEAFNAYAHTLGSNPFLPVVELGLLAIFAIHMFSAIRVTLENRAARPAGYAEDHAVGGSNLASRNMIYSGLLLLVFVIVHLKNFKYGEIVGENLYALVVTTLQSPFWALFYMFFMVVLMAHLRHGFRSAFQSLGALYSLNDLPIQWAGILFAVLIAGGFFLFPVWAMLFARLPH